MKENSIEEYVKILEEKMNKELDFFIENASKAEQLTAISMIAMKEPIILLFLSILSDYKRVLKENEELNLKYYMLYTGKIENLKAQEVKIKSQVIPVQKVKDRIEKYKELSDKFYVKFLESDRYNTDIREKGIKCDAIILALEELIEEREEK